MLRLLAAAGLATLTPTLVSAQTTILRFEGITATDLLDNYGDRVDGPATNGFTYDGSGGFTPNVVANFAGSNGSNNSQMFAWDTGYNDLVDVAYYPYNSPPLGSELVVTLTADDGYGVAIDSFDVGNWGEAITLPYVRVVGETGVVLFEELNVDLEINTSPNERNFVLSPVPRGRILQLRIAVGGLGGNADNVGIDNFQFSQFVTQNVGLGTPYCVPGVDNATGGPTGIRAYGSDVLAQNDVVLMATGMRINTFGFFITSRTQGFVAQPGGSLGNLCVAGAIGRYVGPGQIQNTTYEGNFSLAIDLTDLPTPTGGVAGQVGETWNFQAWHRDFSGTSPTSNFSEAVAVTLQ